MTDIKGAFKAGSAAVWGASRNRRLVLAILPGVVVATVNFVHAYHKRSISDAIIAGLLWLVIYPVLFIRYSPLFSNDRPKT
jgi:hypothetical protein